MPNAAERTNSVLRHMSLPDKLDDLLTSIASNTKQSTNELIYTILSDWAKSHQAPAASRSAKPKTSRAATSRD